MKTVANFDCLINPPTIHHRSNVMDDWGTRFYEEQGQRFGVAQPKDVKYEKLFGK